MVQAGFVHPCPELVGVIEPRWYCGYLCVRSCATEVMATVEW